MVVKGKQNYLLKAKIQEEINKTRDRKKKSILSELLTNAETVNGDIERIDKELIEQLQSLYTDGIDYFRTPLVLSVNQTDYALSIRQKAENANLIIINHSLLIAYSLLLKRQTKVPNPIISVNYANKENEEEFIEYDAETLPEDRKVSVIIDEAHQFDRMAMLLFSKEVSLRDLITVPRVLMNINKTKISREYQQKAIFIKEKIEEMTKMANEGNVNFILLSNYTVKNEPIANQLYLYIDEFCSFANKTYKEIKKIEETVTLPRVTIDKAVRVKEILTVVKNYLKGNKKNPNEEYYLVTFSDERKFPSLATVPTNIVPKIQSCLYNFGSIILIGATLQDPPKTYEKDKTGQGYATVEKFKNISFLLGLHNLLNERTNQNFIESKIFKGFDLKKLATVYFYPDGPRPEFK